VDRHRDPSKVAVGDVAIGEGELAADDLADLEQLAALAPTSTSADASASESAERTASIEAATESG
jgi:hypothetical protein